jgi:hypothetical protein
MLTGNCWPQAHKLHPKNNRLAIALVIYFIRIIEGVNIRKKKESRERECSMQKTRNLTNLPAVRIYRNKDI